MNTVAQLKASRIPATLGLCADDPRLLQLFNVTQEDLLNKGRWFGTYVLADFCSYGGLIAFPRVVANVEQLTVGGQTLDARTPWYEVISPMSQPNSCSSCGCGNGRCGTSDCGACGGRVWVDEGTLPVFRQIHGAKYVKLYPRSASDVGKRVLIQGTDVNREWVRNQYGGIWVDGEYVTIGNPFGLSATRWTAITGVQKDVTNKNVQAYSYDLASGQEKLIADWQPDEVNPSYRVSRLPCLGCRRDDGTCREGTVRALVKLGHVPVSQDTDWLIIGNLVAIEHGMRGHMLYERNQYQLGDTELGRAINCLNSELRTKTGDRTDTLVDIGCESFRDDLNGFQ